MASVGFFLMVLGLVARRLEPVERLLAAFRVADRSRGKARKPGAIFASTWSGWQPPPLPSSINRPVYHQAPRPGEPPPPPPEPGPGSGPEATMPPIAPPRSAEEVREDQVRQWETWAAQPGFYLRDLARKKLAEYRARGPARVGPGQQATDPPALPR